jgi:hypothetical protein
VLVTIIQLSGLAAISLGLGLIYTPAGIISAGVSLVLIGLSIERTK